MHDHPDYKEGLLESINTLITPLKAAPRQWPLAVTAQPAHGSPLQCLPLQTVGHLCTAKHSNTFGIDDVAQNKEMSEGGATTMQATFSIMTMNLAPDFTNDG